MNPKTLIILLNYNSWKDTIECLGSLEKLQYNNFQVFIVDNNSENNSKSQIIDFLNQKYQLEIMESYVYSKNVSPIIKSKNNHRILCDEDLNIIHKQKYLFYPNYVNNGYAAGNNIGIKYALLDKDIKYVWLLNNDTVCLSNTLSELINYSKINSQYGIIGSKLMYYNNPEIIQSLGGGYNPNMGNCFHYYQGQKDTNSFIINKNKIYFVHGASMLINIDVIKKIGLLTEELFLYYEELDFCLRAKKSNIQISICQDSVVYHKEGSSTGSNSYNKKLKSAFSEYYEIRNRFYISKKYFPKKYPFVKWTFLIILFNRLKRFQFSRAFWLFHKLFRTIW